MLPAEMGLSGELLEVRVLYPMIDYFLIAQKVQLLEYQQPSYKPDRLG